MLVSDIVSKLENGAAHLLLFDINSGEILIETIWYDTLKEEDLEREVETMQVRDYELRLGVK